MRFANSIVPEEIMHLCLKYYLQTDEFVDYGPRMTLSGLNNDIITMDAWDEGIFNNVFGKVITDNESNMIYKWKIKIIDLPESDSCWLMAIGICNPEYKADDKLKHSSFIDVSGKFCAFWQDGNIEVKKQYIMDYRNENDTVVKYASNDIMAIQLNTSDKTLKFHKNGVDLGFVKKYPLETNVVFDGAYCLGVSIWEKGSVQLLSFEQSRA